MSRQGDRGGPETGKMRRRQLWISLISKWRKCCTIVIL